jgi:hypothetical protein
MCRGAACSVQVRGCFTTGDRKVTRKVEEWLVQFRQAGDLRSPVVHGGVDVEGIVSAPCGAYVDVPDALKVGCLSAGPRGADEEVTTEIEVLLYRTDLYALGSVPSEIDSRSTVKLLMRISMPFQEVLVTDDECSLHPLASACSEFCGIGGRAL